MTGSQKFCTECGSELVPGSHFCGRCGTAIGVAATPAGSLQAGREEQVLGVVPFLEQGIIAVIHFTLIITTQRLIFCTWNPDTDEAMSDADDAVMEESCNISEIKDEIAHFRAKDWSEGPWQRYQAIPPDTIAAASPGSLVIPLETVVSADIICETEDSTQDTLYIDDGAREHTFDLMYSQGPHIFQQLRPLLGERAQMADHRRKRGKLDRLLTGQEYK